MRKSLLPLILLLFPIFLCAQETSQLKGIGLYFGPLPSSINYTTCFGNYLYIAGDNSIYIYSIVEPENPAYVKSIEHPDVKQIWSGGSSFLAA